MSSWRTRCETRLRALIAAETAEVADEVMISLEQDAVRRAVAELPEPERTALRLHYGLEGDHEPQTFAAIGRQLDMSPERVRAIGERALHELALHRELEALREAA